MGTRFCTGYKFIQGEISMYKQPNYTTRREIDNENERISETAISSRFFLFFFYSLCSFLLKTDLLHKELEIQPYSQKINNSSNIIPPGSSITQNNEQITVEIQNDDAILPTTVDG